MKKLAFLFAPILGVLGCGGGLDCVVTPNDPACAADMSPTLYQVQTGLYKQSGTSTVTSDCSTAVIDPVAARAALDTANRNVRNDTTHGALCIESSSGGTVLGCATVRNNEGSFTSTAVSWNDGTCIWTADTTMTIKVTAKNTLSVQPFSQKRYNWQSVTAGSCKQATTCNVSWSATLTGP